MPLLLEVLWKLSFDKKRCKESALAVLSSQGQAHGSLPLPLSLNCTFSKSRRGWLGQGGLPGAVGAGKLPQQGDAGPGDARVPAVLLVQERSCWGC